MIAEHTSTESRTYQLRTWELHLLLIEIVVLGGAALGWMVRLGPQLFGTDPFWADTAWKGLAFFLLGLVLYPWLRIESRHTQGRTLPFGRWVVWNLAGSAVGAALYLLLR